jgi:hypothetical protein
VYNRDLVTMAHVLGGNASGWIDHMTSPGFGKMNDAQITRIFEMVTSSIEKLRRSGAEPV